MIWQATVSYYKFTYIIPCTKLIKHAFIFPFIIKKLRKLKVFLTIALFNNVRLGIGLCFYQAIFSFSESIVSLKRVQVS